MNIPANLLYTKDHEWLRVEGNTGYIGVTDFAQGELGDVVFIEIETVGETLKKEEVFGTIEAVKTVSICLCRSVVKFWKLIRLLKNLPMLLTKILMAKDGW